MQTKKPLPEIVEVNQRARDYVKLHYIKVLEPIFGREMALHALLNTAVEMNAKDYLPGDIERNVHVQLDMRRISAEVVGEID